MNVNIKGNDMLTLENQDYTDLGHNNNLSEMIGSNLMARIGNKQIIRDKDSLVMEENLVDRNLRESLEEVQVAPNREGNLIQDL